MPSYQNYTNNTPGQTPSSAVNASTFSLSAELVNDGVPGGDTTTFITGPNSGTWSDGMYFLWNFGAGNTTAIDHLDILIKCTTTTVSYNVWGSNDGTTWTLLISAGSFTAVSSTAFKKYTSTTFGATAYQYYEVAVYTAGSAQTITVSDARLWPSNLSWLYEAGPSGAPQGVYAYSDGQGNMKIFWTAVAGATTYDVDVKTTSGSENFSSPVGTGITSTNYTYTGGTLNTMVYAKVRAWVSGSPTSGSNEVGVILTQDKITADMTTRMYYSKSPYKIPGPAIARMGFTISGQDFGPVTNGILIYVSTSDKVQVPYSSSSRPTFGWLWPRTAPGRT